MRLKVSHQLWNTSRSVTADLSSNVFHMATRRLARKGPRIFTHSAAAKQARVLMPRASHRKGILALPRDSEKRNQKPETVKEAFPEANGRLDDMTRQASVAMLYRPSRSVANHACKSVASRSLTVRKRKRADEQPNGPWPMIASSTESRTWRLSEKTDACGLQANARLWAPPDAVIATSLCFQVQRLHHSPLSAESPSSCLLTHPVQGRAGQGTCELETGVVGYARDGRVADMDTAADVVWRLATIRGVKLSLEKGEVQSAARWLLVGIWGCLGRGLEPYSPDASQAPGSLLLIVALAIQNPRFWLGCGAGPRGFGDAGWGHAFPPLQSNHHPPRRPGKKKRLGGVGASLATVAAPVSRAVALSPVNVDVFLYLPQPALRRVLHLVLVVVYFRPPSQYHTGDGTLTRSSGRTLAAAVLL
ncbi:hypothetical protein K402DRAFT_450076 [Aulographum hederae CBS 113979]|uniref:Uncharacterized protein n=1 Tax=Aulographum hederae CBS 113979 TaxID=1176131 RepID=A0A6G1HFE7_9PEZI|nr:hypothetical protein K402DRAFT_450076 [Aulographum hederae CBS 113979]